MDQRVLADQAIARDHMRAASLTLGKRFNFSWGWPLDDVLEAYPHLQEPLRDLSGRIPEHLPVCFFNTKETPCKVMVAVVPVVPEMSETMDTRVVGTGKVSVSVVSSMNKFAQAFLFLLHTGVLPSSTEIESLASEVSRITEGRLGRLPRKRHKR